MTSEQYDKNNNKALKKKKYKTHNSKHEQNKIRNMKCISFLKLS